jgi:hypothetical protein
MVSHDTSLAPRFDRVVRLNAIARTQSSASLPDGAAGGGAEAKP